MVEMAVFNINDVQRAMTPKVDKPELQFLCSARCLMKFYICLRFHENISNGFQLTERTRVHCKMAIFNVQRAITPNKSKPELQFMCSARRLMVLCICVKFPENIANGIRLMEWTRNYEALTDGRTFPQSEIYLVFSLLQNIQQYVKSPH